VTFDFDNIGSWAIDLHPDDVQRAYLTGKARYITQVFKEHTGPLPEDAPSPYPRSWVQWDDEAPFDLMVDEHLVPKFEEIGNHTGVFCHGAYGTWTVSAKPSWWVTRNGRGYLGSS
jgi:hypothetical protein